MDDLSWVKPLAEAGGGFVLAFAMLLGLWKLANKLGVRAVLRLERFLARIEAATERQVRVLEAHDANEAAHHKELMDFLRGRPGGGAEAVASVGNGAERAA